MEAAFKLPAAQQQAALGTLLTQLVDSRDRVGLCELAQGLLVEAQCPRPLAGDVLRLLPPLLTALPSTEGAFTEHVCLSLTDALRAQQVAALDDVDVGLRDALYDVKMQQGQYYAAGAALAAGQIDTAPHLDAPTRGYLWVRVCQAFLRGEDDVTAERYIKKASDLSRHMSKEVLMMFTTTMAQMLDFKKQFLQAAVKFDDISRRGQALDFPPDELLHFLGNAVRCTLLAPVSPARMRMMGSLSRDDRIPFIQPVLLSMLQRMSTERLISAADAAAFEASLPQHCRATNREGVTIFAKAVAEHNVLAASRVYRSISSASLGGLLGMPGEAAQRTVAAMVAGGHLRASIDQVDAVIDFAARGEGGGGAAADPDAATLRSWDKGIKEVCSSINSLVEALKR